MNKLVALFELSVLCGLLAQAPDRIAPVDQAQQNEGFLAFRNQLLDELDQGDLQSVMGHISADVQATHSGRRGKTALRQVWHLDKSSKTFTRELARVLRLGGRFVEPCTFVAPFSWTEFPGSLDVTDYLVVVNDNVQLYEAASLSSPVVSVLHKGDLLKLNGPGSNGLIGVAGPEAQGGPRAFVAPVGVRMPHSYRAFFSNIMSEWKLVGFFDGYD